MNDNKSITKILAITFLFLTIFAVSCNYGDQGLPAAERDGLDENVPEAGHEQTAAAIQEQKTPIPPEPDPVEITVAAVGDIMVHSPQISTQYDTGTGEYDFNNNFQFIKPYIQRSDLALANLETTFAGEEMNYSGYPLFNSPDALADALQKAGFNIISTANNHSIDTGKGGLLRTIKVLQDHKLEVVGTRSDEDEQGFILQDVKGITVGISAYTYETPRQGSHRALNGIPMSKELEKLVDSFCYEHLDEDLLKMKERVERKKEQGAELIIFYLHWGNEYQREPNLYQKKIAEALADFGVDIIFGSHPHVLQPIEYIQSAQSGHETLVVYSLGNFISNQRYETLGNRYTEDGIIVNVTVKKDFVQNLVTVEKVSYIPTWVHRFWEQGKLVYEVLPLPAALENKTDYNLHNENSTWRAQNSKEKTVSLVESELLPVMQTPQITIHRNSTAPAH